MFFRAAYVSAVDAARGVALLAVIVIKLLEKVFVKVGPCLEGVVLTEDARVDVGGNQGCLDKESA